MNDFPFYLDDNGVLCVSRNIEKDEEFIVSGEQRDWLEFWASPAGLNLKHRTNIVYWEEEEDD